MTSRWWLPLLCLTFVLPLRGQTAQQGERCVEFNDNWRFARFGVLPDGTTQKEPEGIEDFSFDDSRWRKLDLPHDWGIEGPFRRDLPSSTGKLPWSGIGWYRKHFRVLHQDKGKRIYLRFDGAMSHARVWVNGTFVGEWPYGYASFQLDITDALRYGTENVVAVRLENPPASSRWYPGGGLYRNVWLLKTHPVHIPYNGIFISTPVVTRQNATIRIHTEIANDTNEPKEISVSHTIRYSASDVVLKVPMTLVALIPHSLSSTVVEVNISLPVLWDVESPSLYECITVLREGTLSLDSVRTTFGIRSAVFSADSGFFLNGRKVYLKGVCNHHDLGILGAAVHPKAIERQLRILQEMGCNALRTSHNPPAPELLDLCDRLGILVIDEAFDCWEQGKTPNDYHTLFPQWHEKDIRAFVRRDRNHPSVIAWSAGNEVREQNGPELLQKLKKIFLAEDSTRPITAGCDKPDAGFNGFQEVVDVFGYNYKPHLYGKFHDEHPTKPLYGSETASCVSSNGEYYFPIEGGKTVAVQNNQVSSYDLYTPWWGTLPDVEFEAQDQYPFVAGEFVWTGFDYLGEPTPFFDDSSLARSSYFGVVDLCGFRKDRFYLYQARWRPDFPMAHILPHWNWHSHIGARIPVFVYTSGDEAELFLNGKSLGKKKKERFQYRLRWDSVMYEPGELKVIAYKNGKEWATDLRKTSGAPFRIVLSSSDTLLKADGKDLAFITVTVVDTGGNIVPTARNHISFKIHGTGKLAAVGNGDPTDHTSFFSSHYQVFHGQALLILRSLSERGKIIVEAESEGLRKGTLLLYTQ